MVIILEDEHTAASKALFSYTKYGLISMMLNVASMFIITMICAGIIRALISGFIAFLIFFLNIRKTIKSVNLKRVDNILFGPEFDNYYPNTEEVYNATISISKMHGFIIGSRNTISCINAIAVILDVAIVVITFIMK